MHLAFCRGVGLCKLCARARRGGHLGISRCLWQGKLLWVLAGIMGKNINWCQKHEEPTVADALGLGAQTPCSCPSEREPRPCLGGARPEGTCPPRAAPVTPPPAEPGGRLLATGLGEREGQKARGGKNVGWTWGAVGLHCCSSPDSLKRVLPGCFGPLQPQGHAGSRCTALYPAFVCP